MVKVQRLFAKTNLNFQFAALVPSRVWGRRDCLGTAPVNSVYVFDDRVVLNFNFTDDAKTVTREEVLDSSAVDNVPACWDRTR